MTTKDKLDLNNIDVSKLKRLTKEDCKEGVRVFWVYNGELRDTGIIPKSYPTGLFCDSGYSVHVKWDSDGNIEHARIDSCYILEEELPIEQKYSIKEVAKILGLELTYVEHKFDNYNNNLNNKIK